MYARIGRGWVRVTAARLGVGAIAVLAAGVFASPAYADTTADLEVKLTGTTLSPGQDGKLGSLSILNHGPSDAADITLTFDISELDETKIEVDSTGCTATADEIVCVGDSAFIIKNGEDVDFLWPLVKVGAAAPGPAGKVTATVTHGGTDPESGNNSVTADVVISDSTKPDLTTLAFDVYKVDGSGTGPEEITDQPIPPGGTSNLWIVVLNQGDTGADGVKLSITLPEDVSFTTPEPGDCTHAVGDSTTVCNYVFPLTEAGTEDSEALFFFEVKVSEDAVGPAALTGGVATAEAIIEAVEVAAPAALPRNVTRVKGILDNDDSDNTDDFTVFVAGPGGNAPLPNTGVKVGLIAGAGAAAVALGVLLFVAARKRRLPAATP
jgi:LPXTG-motif cell wall-anchored protein